MNDTSTVGRPRFGVTRMLVVALVVAASVMLAPSQAKADPSDDASVAVALVNQARWANGLGGLMPDRELQILANRQANRMAAAGYIFHSGNLEGQLSAGWWGWAENVGYGPSVGWIHDAFMNSPHHASNVLNGSFNYVGVGVAYGWDGTVYVAQVFGAW